MGVALLVSRFEMVIINGRIDMALIAEKLNSRPAGQIKGGMEYRI